LGLIRNPLLMAPPDALGPTRGIADRAVRPEGLSAKIGDLPRRPSDAGLEQYPEHEEQGQRRCR
jgi:hypothetical protein